MTIVTDNADEKKLTLRIFKFIAAYHQLSISHESNPYHDDCFQVQGLRRESRNLFGSRRCRCLRFVVPRTPWIQQSRCHGVFQKEDGTAQRENEASTSSNNPPRSSDALSCPHRNVVHRLATHCHTFRTPLVCETIDVVSRIDFKNRSEDRAHTLVRYLLT